jgi:general L-amino acid transport system permease protein
MAAYVEIFRNVPVLIWILIINAIFLVSLPQPKAFKSRGGNPPEAEMFLDAFAFTGRGIYMPKPVLQGGGLLVVGVFFLSIVAMFLYRRHARNLLYSQGKDLPTFWPSVGILFAPAILSYALMAFTSELPIVLEYPALKGFNFKGGIWARGSFVALTFALAIYTGAFIAENVRAGILAISKGQTEAAASLGIRPNRIMSLVILPQALRVIIPPMISNYLNLTKNSSLAIAVGYMDITGTLGGITLNQTGRAIEAILLLMAFYLLISLSISAIMNVYNKSVAIKER